MTDSPEKQNRPPGQDETTDPDISQDPGIPGPKVEEELPPDDESSPGHGFPGSGNSQEDQSQMRQAAEADATLAPGSMPPSGDDNA